MDIVCSPAGIVNPYRPGQGIMDMAGAGFRHMSLELDMCCSSYELEHLGEPQPERESEAENDLSFKRRGVRREFEPISESPGEMRRFFKNMTDLCEGKLDIPLALAPYLPRDTKRADLIVRDGERTGASESAGAVEHDLLDRLTEIDREAIRYCGSLGCEYIVIRPISLSRPEGIRAAEQAPHQQAPDEQAPHQQAPDQQASRQPNPRQQALDQQASRQPNPRQQAPHQPNPWRANLWQVNRDFYLGLAGAARESHVKILLTNQYVLNNGHAVRGVCSDGREAAEWVDSLNREAGEELFGFCVDVGVCSLCGQDMYGFASELGTRIKAVILRDCDGRQEGSMLPFTAACQGQPRTDWLSLIRGLRQCGFDGWILLSMSDTAASFSPLLRPQLMSLARACGEYFKWQLEIENVLKRYDSIVLFGAGNMCRNYMKCYGEAYPPLFTCDNNRNIWGTDFCGLEVKPPEALKTIPDNCGVLICNIYYREIEKQLKDMGIEHVEFFNDEYMPTFHFDRLRGV